MMILHTHAHTSSQNYYHKKKSRAAGLLLRSEIEEGLRKKRILSELVFHFPLRENSPNTPKERRTTELIRKAQTPYFMLFEKWDDGKH
jgi:hypothetical protein